MQPYDVVIVGGAMIGASVAWHLSQRGDFSGRVLVVERDPGFEFASSSHTNSCMRQQFSTEVNIRISQYCADFIRNFRDHMRDHEGPKIHVHPFGYLYLAADAAAAEHLRQAQALQARLGAGTRLLDARQIAQRWPFLVLDDVVLGSFNDRDEGYFDGATMADWWRRQAKRAGVETITDEVVALEYSDAQIQALQLKSGARIACGALVNAAGPRAAQLAAMAGIDLPVEPRKRYTYVFQAEKPLPCDLPLTVDPSGIHVRTDGRNYMVGAAPEDDGPVAPDDFAFDHGLWERRVWPALAARIPAFERIRVLNEWVGHYAYNRIDQNAVIGPHPELGNLFFANGFSGHGFQQAPAVGRALAELICTGGFETLDLSDLGFARLLEGRALKEAAII